MTVSPLSNDEEPYTLFNTWFTEAKEKEINDPNAMALATKEQDGRLSLRMVLLKSHDKRGFVFFTNFESDKGKALLSNPEASLLFHWKSVRRQIRIEGLVEEVTTDEADSYFHTRPRQSRIGAWASQQSRPMETKQDFINSISHYTVKFGLGKIKRPPYWSGFRVIAHRIEFWQDGSFRLHDRLVYTRENTKINKWQRQILYP